MILYKTVSREADAEQIIEKSKFIAHVSPVSGRDEGEAFIARIRGSYRDATHNVPVMVIGDKFQIQWASDDGEPQGTSGAPIVQMLVKEGITNVAVVVTRYFGGIKLGTGGLVRAYTGTARLGIEAAAVREVKEICEIVAVTDYHSLSLLQNMADKSDFVIKDIKYEEKVTITAAADAEAADGVKKLLTDSTSGNIKIVSETLKTS